MSVIKSNRSESKLAAITKSRDLCVYTVEICKNEKHFPKRDRWILTTRIVTEAVDAYSCIRRANATRVETALDYRYRLNQQIEAFAHYESMLGLIDIAYTSLHLSDDRVEHWTGLLVDAENCLLAWKKSDKARYKDVP